MIYSLDPAIDYQKAIDIALSYLDTLPNGIEYIKDVSIIQEQGEYWECWFLRKKSARSLGDIIAVHKVSGKVCSWLNG